MYKRNRPILPTWLTLALSVAFVLSGVSVSAFMFLTADAALNHPLNPLEQAAQQAAGTALPPLVQVGPAPLATLPPGQPTPTLFPTTEPWEGNDRVTILLMGIDRRPGEPFISRTDTMMLISMDPVAKTISMLSVPRDLYVVIPGRGRDRINTAFVYGSVGNNPAAGAALAMQTVQYNLGVPINHYVLVDFQAVIQAIDTIGGIDVDVPFTIDDPNYPTMDYGIERLFIPAGRQHLDGTTALKYARTRHPDNDFGRASRQQQVILAVRAKVLSLGLGQLLLQAPALYQQLGEGIRTDLSLEQMLRLAQTAGEIPSENIRNEVLDTNYVVDYQTDAGARVLILVNEKAAPLIQELFYQE
ncbi:MAG: LCP family protein [Chloroflexota bacterium]